MGLLTAITIFIALIVDFLFLPALLMKLDKDNQTETTVEPLDTPTNTDSPANTSKGDDNDSVKQIA
jgi:hypothetical protein